MKQRLTKNPPSIIQDLIELAKSTRLYILKKNGPASLKYCDEDGNKFKVELSTTMYCSCNDGKQHCIHTIHALLKVYKVDETNPILWQNQYSQYEIMNILNGTYISQTQQKIKKQQRIPSHQQELQQDLNNEEQQLNRQQINKDDPCPICQEQLDCKEAIVYCKKQCGNNFHAKCMKVWVLQKQSAGKKKIDCPMCRVDWGETALVEIRQEEKLFENQHKTHKKVCVICKISPIIGILYTCISCPNSHLCSKCYGKNIHQHSIFLFKENRLDDYKLVNKITMNDLIKLFPENLNANVGNTGGLVLIGAGIQKSSKCNFCQNTKNLRLLPCGHIADEQCLIKLKENSFICPIDLQPQFLGLFNTLTNEEKQHFINESKKWIIKKEADKQKIDRLPPISGKHGKQNLPPENKEKIIKKYPSHRSSSLKRDISLSKQLDLTLQVKSVKNQYENIF